MEIGLILEYFYLSLILPQLIRLLVYFHDYKYWIPTITFMLQIHPVEIDLQLLYSFLLNNTLLWLLIIMNPVGTNTYVGVSGVAVAFKQRALHASCIIMSLIPRKPGYRQQCYRSEDPNGNGIGTETKRKVQYTVDMSTLIQDRTYCYRPQGKVMLSQVCVILFTIGLMTTQSLFILVMVWLVCILLECFLVFYCANPIPLTGPGPSPVPLQCDYHKIIPVYAYSRFYYS